ncbi:hypothetical protein [Prosthecobacter sp.]|uniref:hypothetical protein n=1 Tax=Prosthecobacter sp. TaxID=1965333 RepID=UPI003784EE09
MSTPQLDTLAKAPLFVHLAIVGVNAGPTAVDSTRFNEHVEASGAPNARISVYTDALQHLAIHFQRLYGELTQAQDSAPVIEQIQAAMSEQLTPSDKLQFVLHLGRVAAAAVRDDHGNPVPERVAVADQMAELFQFMPYGKNNERYTDGLQVTTYWPGVDPALQRFSEAELRQLSAVFGCLHAAMSGCHGGELGEARKAALKQCLMEGYTPGMEACAAHALLRYFDQLFWLVFAEIQFAERPKPVFVQGHALVMQKLDASEQTAFNRHIQNMAAALVTEGSPPMARDTLTSIMALMQGQDVEIDGGGLPEPEWDVLSMGLVASFLLVAAADGHVGDKECQTFASIIQAVAEGVPTSLILKAAARIPDRMHVLWPAVTARGAHPPRMVAEAVVLAAAKFTAEEFDLYRRVALAIAVKTAEAEGGGFLGLGSKISKDEQKVIDGLKKLLGFA